LGQASRPAAALVPSRLFVDAFLCTGPVERVCGIFTRAAHLLHVTGNARHSQKNLKSGTVVHRCRLNSAEFGVCRSSGSCPAAQRNWRNTVTIFLKGRAVPGRRVPDDAGAESPKDIPGEQTVAAASGNKRARKRTLVRSCARQRRPWARTGGVRLPRGRNCYPCRQLPPIAGGCLTTTLTRRGVLQGDTPESETGLGSYEAASGLDRATKPCPRLPAPEIAQGRLYSFRMTIPQLQAALPPPHRADLRRRHA
jgi:hypothetical protein